MLETIQARYMREAGNREQALEKARECAKQTRPWILPPEGLEANGRLEEPFQGMGARGTTSIVGKMLLALFPPGRSWFNMAPAKEFELDPSVDPALLNDLRSLLASRERLVLSAIESASIKDIIGARRRRTFLSTMRAMLDQIIITGDSLAFMDQDLSIKLFRRDQYVVVRLPSQQVQAIGTKESIDSASLTDEQLRTANLNPQDERAKPYNERMLDLYTWIEWQPSGRNWLIRQEIDEQQISEERRKVNPYFVVPYELAPADNYGRGLIEANLSDLRTLNHVAEDLVNFSGIAGKHLFVTDYSSMVRPRDLTKPTGSVIKGRVEGGEVQDIAILRSDKGGDFNIVLQQGIRIEEQLGRAFLLDSEAQPTGERVTRAQVDRVAQELDGALGGVYAPIADELQTPILANAISNLEKQGRMPAIPDEFGDAVEVRMLTGIAALGRAGKMADIRNHVENIGQFGPELVMQEYNMGVLFDIFERYGGIDEPGLRKTAEQKEEEAQQQIQQQALASLAAAGGQSAGEQIGASIG